MRFNPDRFSSVGVAVLGIIVFCSPSLTELGLGISAIGVAFYAASKGRHPAWGVFPLLPVLGTLVVLVVLNVLRPKDRATADALSRGRRLLRHPLVWAIPFLLVAVVAWQTCNPSATSYRNRAYNAAAEADLRNAATAQEAYYVDNQTYADSIEKLVGSTYGLYTSENITVRVLSASENDYMMEAFHKRGNRKYTITGPDGVIQVGIYKSKLSAKSYESQFAFGPYQVLGNNDELWLFLDFPRMVKRPGSFWDTPRVIPIGRFQEVVVLDDNGLKKRIRVSMKNGVTFHSNISHIFVYNENIFLHMGESMFSLNSIFRWDKDHFELLPFQKLEELVPGFKNMKSYKIDQQLDQYTNRYGWKYIYDTNSIESFIKWKKWQITIDAFYKGNDMEVTIIMTSQRKKNNPIILSYEKDYKIFNRKEYKKLMSEKHQEGHEKP